jgi:excisionase family DNA binding protein
VSRAKAALNPQSLAEIQQLIQPQPGVASSFPQEMPMHARHVAALLGMCEETILRLARRGEIPHFRIGRSLRFYPSRVMAALEGKRGA